MKHLKAILIAAAITAALSTGAGAMQRTDEAAAEFIRSLGNRVISVLDDDTMSRPKRVAAFYRLFKSAFDSDRVSAFALGKYRRMLPDEKFAEYSELFGKYMVGLYATKFADYAGASFAITGSQQESGGRSEVMAEIRRPDHEPVNLTFRIGQADGLRKINDVLIEGVSLLFTKRQEVTTVIGREGLDTLLERLEEAVQLAELP